MNKLSKQNVLLSRWVFLFSIIVSVYWVVGTFINVYESKISGAVFEILWLPMLALLFVIPVVAIIYWVKSHFKFNSPYFFALLLIAVTLAICIIRSN